MDHDEISIHQKQLQFLATEILKLINELREHTLIMWEGGRRVLEIFQNIFRSPGDHRPKYSMAQ